MNIKPIKFIVQVHFIEEDDEGNVIGEKFTDPYNIFGTKAFREFAKNFDKELMKAVESASPERDTST